MLQVELSLIIVSCVPFHLAGLEWFWIWNEWNWL